MSSKKVLILYYSGSGNTKKMAKAISEAMKSSAINVTVEDVGKLDISLLPNYDSIVNEDANIPVARPVPNILGIVKKSK
jgi:flavodoxin